MANTNSSTWRLDRRISLSVLVQLMVLASLIVGSWLNLQRQLDILQRDVTMLLQAQECFAQKIETLSAQSLEHGYRLQALERQFHKTVAGNRPIRTMIASMHRRVPARLRWHDGYHTRQLHLKGSHVPLSSRQTSGLSRHRPMDTVLLQLRIALVRSR